MARWLHPALKIQCAALRALPVAPADTLCLTITPDCAPLPDIIRRLPFRAQSIHLECFTCDDKVTGVFAEWAQKGAVERVSYCWDRASIDLFSQKHPDYIPAIESVATLELDDTHRKHAIIRGEDGSAYSILSSSNEGTDPGRSEWWCHTGDHDVAAWLDGVGGEGDWKPDLQRSVTLLQTGNDLPSAAMLERVLEYLGSGVDLRLGGFSTSKGMLELLSDWRYTGKLSSLRFVLDNSVLSMMSAKNFELSKNIDIVRETNDLLPGMVAFSKKRMHAKWATLRKGDICVAVLSSANWQITNIRKEEYVILVSREACDLLDACLESVATGEPMREVSKPVDGDALDWERMPIWQVMILEKIARGQNPQGLANWLAEKEGADPAEFQTFAARFAQRDAVVALALEQALGVRVLASRGAKIALTDPLCSQDMIDAAIDHSSRAAKLLLEVSAYPIPMERVTTATDVRALTDADLLLKLKSMVRT